MITLLSHLSHVEIATPDVEASVVFYEERLGLRDGRPRRRQGLPALVGRLHAPQRRDLRGAEPALVEIGWRTTSPEALEEAARRVEEAGVTGEWSDSAPASGRSYVSPVRGATHAARLGHRAVPGADDDHASIYPDRPRSARARRRPALPRPRDDRGIRRRGIRAVAPRRARLPHHGLHRLDEAPSRSSPSSRRTRSRTTSASCSTAPARPRQPLRLLGRHPRGAAHRRRRAHGERHAHRVRPVASTASASRTSSTSATRALRIEVNTGGYRNYVPDWEPNTWKPSTGSNNFYRNGAMPMSMTESFPPRRRADPRPRRVSPRTEEALLNPYAKHGQG